MNTSQYQITRNGGVREAQELINICKNQLFECCLGTGLSKYETRHMAFAIPKLNEATMVTTCDQVDSTALIENI